MLAWLSVWSEVQTCIPAQLMPLPLTVSCSSKIQIGFTFLVPAPPGSPGKRAVTPVCVCVLIFIDLSHLELFVGPSREAVLLDHLPLRVLGQLPLPLVQLLRRRAGSASRHGHTTTCNTSLQAHSHRHKTRQDNECRRAQQYSKTENHRITEL